MKTVKVNVEELLKTVKKNRDAHRELFLKAQEGYREMVIEELDRMLSDARTGKPLRVSIKAPQPEDHTDDYDRVLKMLIMSVDEEIELDVLEFDRYVMDNWEWARLAAASNTMYANKSW